MRPKWWTRVLVTVLAVVALELALVAGGNGPRLLVVAALVGVLATATWLTLDLGRAVVPTEWPSTQPPETYDGVEWRVARIRILLLNVRASDGANLRLHELLVGLIDDRLFAEHRIDRAVDQTAAASILGPELTKFVTARQPMRQLSQTREVARIVTLIENL